MVAKKVGLTYVKLLDPPTAPTSTSWIQPPPLRGINVVVAAFSTPGMARTAAVNAITLGQVFYLLNSRYLIDSSLTPHAHGGNPWLYWGIGAVIVLQLLFTYAPPFHAIFGNESLPLWVWPRLIGGGIVFFLAVELEKLVIRSVPALRRAATHMDEGLAA